MSSKLLVVLGLAVAAAVANGGCTGSHSASNAAATAGSCSKLTPCGGAVVGQWKVSSLCLDNPGALISTKLQEPACQGTIRSYDIRASGSYQFTADGTASDDVRFTIDMDALWTSACLTAIAHGAAIDLAATCTAIEMNYSQNAQFAGASCEVAGTACSCMVTSVENRSTNSGHYTIDGTNLVEDQGSSSYCVAGNTLRIHSAGTDGAGMLTLTR